MQLRGVGLLALSTAAVVVACKSDGERAVGQTTVTSGNVDIVANDVAVDRLTRARCARETRCARLGVERSFTTPEACDRNVRSGLAIELDAATSCPLGLDRAKLDTCLRAIEREACDNAVETVARLVACRASELCLRTDPSRRAE